MARLPLRSELAFAEHAGECGEGGRHPEPEIAGVGISAGVQQQSRDLEYCIGRDIRVDPRVRQIQQRWPRERPAFDAGECGVDAQVAAHLLDVVGCRRGVDALLGDLGVLAEQLPCLRPSPWSVIRVVQTGNSHELVDRVIGRFDLARCAHELRDDIEVLLEPRP